MTWRGTLNIQAALLMGALAVQYALGMYVNLFVSFPDNATEGQLWDFAWSEPALGAHIILATLIFIGATVLCIRASRRRDRRWITASFIGLLAVFGAGASGAQFVPSQIDAYSYSMSIMFLIALFSYAWGIFGSRRSDVVYQK